MCRCHPPGGRCECSVGRLRGYIEPCAVLLLAERPAHGYDLLPRLSKFGLEAKSVDAGTLYRTLRRLEEEGILTSDWHTSGGGPARRIYRVTPAGFEFLRAWQSSIEDIKANLDVFCRSCQAILRKREGE